METVDIRYNECLREFFFKKYENDDYENVPSFAKTLIATINCMLGEVDIVKLKCIRNGKQFIRKEKFKRIN